MRYFCEKGKKTQIFRIFCLACAFFNWRWSHDQKSKLHKLYLYLLVYLYTLRKYQSKVVKILPGATNSHWRGLIGDLCLKKGLFWPFFTHFSVSILFFTELDKLGLSIYDFLKLHYNGLHMSQKASHWMHLLPSYGFLWHEVSKK